MKNQTKRVEDAIANSRTNKRARIGEKRFKEPTPEERERAKNSRLMRVDNEVREMLNRLQAETAKRNAALEGDPLESPFKNDRERIKFNNDKYASVSVATAFADCYGVKLDPEVGNNVPTEITLGDIIKIRIASVSKKGGVVFDPGSYKENFATRCNLARYPKFEHFRPLDKISAQVIEITPKTTMVDIFGPAINEFLVPRAKAPWIQNVISGAAVPVTVKNLRLVRGGYMGQAVIPTLSEFIGEDFVVDAFIPGSQIVLNATDNFEQFEGTDVQTFIMSYSPRPNGRGMSLVCSVKSYLKYLGSLKLKEFFNAWCDSDEAWNKLAERTMIGTVTGVLNSAKKCGVFVEISELNITGMIPTSANELVNFKAGDEIAVRFKSIEEDMVYNDAAGQLQHLPPFEIVDGAIKKVNIKPIFELV